MRIYTRGGDGGVTDLFGAGRVSKSTPRIAVLGDVDELNAALGWAASQLPALRLGDLDLGELLRELQADLLTAGADLATPRSARDSAQRATRRIVAARVDALEGWIDRCEDETAPLTRFILPSGCSGAAALHLARATCRRCERTVVQLAEAEPVSPDVLRYLNRLSDLLFALARWVNACEGVEEQVWDPTD